MRKKRIGFGLNGTHEINNNLIVVYKVAKSCRAFIVPIRFWEFFLFKIIFTKRHGSFRFVYISDKNVFMYTVDIHCVRLNRVKIWWGDKIN